MAEALFWRRTNCRTAHRYGLRSDMSEAECRAGETCATIEGVEPIVPHKNLYLVAWWSVKAECCKFAACQGVKPLPPDVCARYSLAFFCSHDTAQTSSPPSTGSSMTEAEREVEQLCTIAVLYSTMQLIPHPVPPETSGR